MLGTNYDYSFAPNIRLDDREISEFYVKTKPSDITKECLECGKEKQMNPKYNICKECSLEAK